MFKKNNKGFLLMETLLVSVFICSTLIFLFIQFKKVRSSYDTSFSYNTINGVYGANTFLKYLQENGIENLSTTINTNATISNINITDCPSGYLKNTTICNQLITNLEIKNIYYTSSDITKFKENMPASLSNTMQDFVRSIKKANAGGYRLIVEYNDNTYASILARSNSFSPY